MRSGNWHDGDGDADDNGEDRDDFNVVFFDPGFGFWGDPFYWDGLGYFGGYAMAPDDNYRDSRAAAPPAGYDCDGWRWDAAAGRYVAAKVSCK
jgi:hypothetical protein